VFAAPSYAQSVGEKTRVNPRHRPKTEDFIEEAAMSDMTEIEAAKIAQQKGNVDEKKFAEMMLADHTKTSTELKSMVPDNLKAALPAAPDDASQKKIAKPRED
jgi:putative membrane protein